MGPQPPPVAPPSGTAEAGTSTADFPRLLPLLPMMPPLPMYVPPPAVSQLTNLISTDNNCYFAFLAIPKLCREGHTRAARRWEGVAEETGEAEATGRPRRAVSDKYISSFFL